MKNMRSPRTGPLSKKGAPPEAVGDRPDSVFSIPQSLRDSSLYPKGAAFLCRELRLSLHTPIREKRDRVSGLVFLSFFISYRSNMVFAFNSEYAKQVKIRTDIRRGEDGSLALSLKQFGRISFLYRRSARPVTGYGTLKEDSLFSSFIHHVKIQSKGIFRIFYKRNHYEDSSDNLIL